jgi:hypothetical protein
MDFQEILSILDEVSRVYDGFLLEKQEIIVEYAGVD